MFGDERVGLDLVMGGASPDAQGLAHNLYSTKLVDVAQMGDCLWPVAIANPSDEVDAAGVGNCPTC